MATNTTKPKSGDGIFLGAFDIHLKTTEGEHVMDCTLPARFFHNYQRETPVWIEVEPAGPWLAGAEVTVTAPSHVTPFPAVLGGLMGVEEDGSLSFVASVEPLISPIESVS